MSAVRAPESAPGKPTAPGGTVLLESTHVDLETLRTTIDQRLLALEEALADPGDRTPSLEMLIAELARLATTEAQATAARASLDAKRVSEAAIVDAQARAGADLAAERATNAELRKALQQAQRRV